MKILIVDDSAFMRNMIKNVLKDGNFDIKEAGDFDTAVNTFKEFSPDITFLDIVLPGKTGIDVLKEIKAVNNTAKVVMCTSIGGQQEIVDEAIKLGAADVITKPFKQEDIMKIVQG
jgi:two-component system, chemotaxis family, chemotaxis protein CheY